MKTTIYIILFIVFMFFSYGVWNLHRSWRGFLPIKKWGQDEILSTLLGVAEMIVCLVLAWIVWKI